VTIQTIVLYVLNELKKNHRFQNENKKEPKQFLELENTITELKNSETL
jgi:hypothetical protein